MITQDPQTTVEQMEAAWREAVSASSTPDYFICSPQAYKRLLRYWRSKRKGKSKETEITEALRVELGIPAASAPRTNEWWGSETCRVDKRCLKRYRRRAARA